MKPKDCIGGKKVLVVGLGLIAGGATVQWLVRHGADVTVTDLWPRGKPDDAIARLGDTANMVRFTIGEYRTSDFDSADILVVNPSIPPEDPHVARARKRGARIENELTLFLRFCPSAIIGVTGTRGKTTTTVWAHHLLRSAFASARRAGNTGDIPLLSMLDELEPRSPVAVELSSFQLSLLPEVGRSPHVAVVTNIMRDHLNRHRTMEAYADAKAHIFRYQTKQDVLVLQKEGRWTDYLLGKSPAGTVLFYDESPLGFPLPAGFVRRWGQHNAENVRAAAHAAHAAGAPWGKIAGAVASLPPVPFRQEVVANIGATVVVNDTAATIPDASLTAIERFKRQGTLVLIAGGTDKKLEYTKWAECISKEVAPDHIFLLSGSATEKMRKGLGADFMRRVSVSDVLEECVRRALDAACEGGEKAVVLFSPGAASFEKFTNEFERGAQFNALIKQYAHRATRRE